MDDEFSPRVPDDLRRADDWATDEPPRSGLEGLSAAPGEVYGFHEIRLFNRNTPWHTALFLWWCMGIAFITLAIWDGRIILGALGGIVVASAVWWTVSLWRSPVDSRRIRDRFGPDGEERQPNR